MLLFAVGIGIFLLRVSDTVGRLPYHLPEQYVYSVNVWVGVS